MMINLLEIEMPIDMGKFSMLFAPNVRKVIEILQKYHVDLRIIGGAVRDFVLGKDPRDIDFATNAEPAELMFIFDLEGIKHDDSGVQHGTIKALIDDDVIDVTSITYKLRVDHGHVVVDRGASWLKDAARRDLSINSMSVDIHGRLYDYRNGLDDLKNQMIRFNPNAQEKILEDPFTMLRWFKAIDMFDDPKWRKQDRILISKHAQLIKKVLDQKRAQRLLAHLKGSSNWSRTRDLMCKIGIAEHIGVNC